MSLEFRLSLHHPSVRRIFITTPDIRELGITTLGALAHQEPGDARNNAASYGVGIQRVPALASFAYPSRRLRRRVEDDRGKPRPSFLPSQLYGRHQMHQRQLQVWIRHPHDLQRARCRAIGPWREPVGITSLRANDMTYTYIARFAWRHNLIGEIGCCYCL